jgi:hypothetical protein
VLGWITLELRRPKVTCPPQPAIVAGLCRFDQPMRPPMIVEQIFNVSDRDNETQFVVLTLRRA